MSFAGEEAAQLQLRAHDLLFETQLMAVKNMNSPLVSFRFLNGSMNAQLRHLLLENKIDHSVSDNGLIFYRLQDEEFIENELISSIRNKLFPLWQILFCPEEDRDGLLGYMKARNIRYEVEIMDGKLTFLLPAQYRPHSWKYASKRKTLGSKRKVKVHSSSNMQ